MTPMGSDPMATRKVYQVGGSIVVSLPRSVRKETGIEEGMTVIVEADNGAIRVAEAEISEAHRPDGGN